MVVYQLCFHSLFNNYLLMMLFVNNEHLWVIICSTVCSRKPRGDSKSRLALELAAAEPLVSHLHPAPLSCFSPAWLWSWLLQSL